MPKYVDRVIWMANTGMNWQHFDTTYRQKRAKRLQRRNRKVRSWSKNDIELYISCSSVISRDVTQQPRFPAPASHQMVSK